MSEIYFLNATALITDNFLLNGAKLLSYTNLFFLNKYNRRKYVPRL